MITTYRRDIDRYRSYRPDSSFVALLILNQGLWALLQYRVAHSLYLSGLHRLVKTPLLGLCVIWQKLIEIGTNMEIPYRARIAPGLYIGHSGPLVIHPDAVIGPGCNLSQGVTLGISGRGERRGVPTLGSRVYIGANAVLAGKITVGDEGVVAANALVTRDVPSKAVMVGNPAQIVSYDGSEGYIDP